MSNKKLIKSASIISSATLVSRVLGFLRDVLLAQVFGTGWIIQAYFVAFRIPNMFRELAAEGASNAAFVPVFSEYIVTKEHKEFWKIVNTVFLAFLVMVGGLCVSGSLLSGWLVRLIAPGFIHNPEQLQLAVSMNRIFFIYLIFICISAFMTGVLYSFKSFVWSSFSPAVFNAVLIVSLLWTDNSIKGIWRQVTVVLFAGLLQVIFQYPEMVKKGFKLKPFDYYRGIFQHSAVKKVQRLLLPRMLGTGLYQINVLIDTIFASLTFFAGEGAIAALYYSTRLIQFPLGIFSHSISNASLPTLSELSAKKDMEKFAATVKFSLTNIFFIIIPASFGLMVLAHPIIQVIFQRGEFDLYSTHITSLALGFFALGLAGYAANKFLALCFNAMQDTRTPVKISAIGLLLNILFNIIFVIVLRAKVAGLAFSSSLSAIISSYLLYRLLHKRVNLIDSKEIIRQTVKMFFCGLIMAGVIFVAQKWLSGCLSLLLSLAGAISLGIIVYGAMSIALGVEQANKIFQWISKKR